MGLVLKRIAASLVFLLFMTSGTADAQFGFSLDLGQGDNNEPVEFDLGERTEGETYEIRLEAVNENCEAPQDFRFDFSEVPWMYPQGDNTVRGLRAGERGDIVAIVDFTSTAPGQYSGEVSVHCATCQFLIFNTCHIDRRVLNFDVNVQPSAVAQADQADIDFWGPEQPGGIDFEEGQPEFGGQPVDMDGAEQQQPHNDNEAITTAPRDDTDFDTTGIPTIGGDVSGRAPVSTPATRAAYAELARLAALKDPCAEELARLRALAATAAAAAATAAAEAAQAADEAAAAEQHLADYQDELDAAQRAMDSTYRTLQMQAAYRTIVSNEDGTGSARYAEADQLVNDANDAAVEAQREFQRVRSSYDARAAAAQAARQNADDKQAAADAAQAAADAAAAAVAAKELECQDLERQCVEAQQAAVAAQTRADQEAAAAAAAAEEAEQERIRAARQRCDDCREAIRRHARVLDKAFGAMRDIGMLSSGNQAPGDVNLEQIVAGSFIQTLAQACADIASLPTFEVFTALDALQAAYGLIAIRQLQLTPNTRGYLGDEYLATWLVEHGHADNPREANEIVREITRFREANGNTQYLKDRFERMMRDCQRICCER